MSRKTTHANKCAKVYEVEQELKGQGWFVFRRTQSHGLFHVIGFNKGITRMVQVLRLHSFNFKDINNELVKIQEFIELEQHPEKTDLELWVWVNNKGWVKYFFYGNGQFHKYQDYGTNDFRKPKK